MQTSKLIFMGLGTVAQGLLKILQEKSEVLAQEHGIRYDVVAVCTGSRGNLFDPKGLQLSQLLEASSKRQPFTENITTLDNLDLIKECGADILIEMSPSDLTTGQPAIQHCEAALQANIHVVCANKGPAVLAHKSLAALAENHKRYFLNEATVLSGTPVFSFAQTNLAGNRITEIRGILNGSTNYILSEMEKGHPRDTVMQRAADLGYLEADPRGDIDGHDAQGKLAILANILMGASLDLNDIETQGIADLDTPGIQSALASGTRWKLVAELKRTDHGIQAQVKPQQLSLDHPLAQINGTDNALTFTTDLLGEVTIQGPGAGSIETGYGVLSDLLTIQRGSSHE